MRILKITLIFLLILTIPLFYFGWKIYGPQVQVPAQGVFYVQTGSNYDQVLASLKAQNILSSTTYFEWLNKYRHYDRSIKPGRYKIVKGMSVWELFSMLRAGKQDPVRFVISKIRTREELAARMGKYLETDSLQAIRFLYNNDSLRLLGLDSNTVLSQIIPNTYLFWWNSSPFTTMKRLKKQHDGFWEGDREKKAASLGLTPLQITTIASIVEEETNKEKDKGNIASVYLNRIKKNMKLEADPTVKFAMKDFGLKRILFKHLTFESPYNTYLHAGIPPGPICTPSVFSIDAVLNAPTTSYLFFVAKADFSGYSVFAETLAEHQKNATAYQQALNEYLKKKKEAEKAP